MKSPKRYGECPKSVITLEEIVDFYRFKDMIFKLGPNLLGKIEFECDVQKAVESWSSVVGVCGVGQYSLECFPIYTVGRVDLSGEGETQKVFIMTRVMKTKSRDGNPSEEEIISAIKEVDAACNGTANRYVLIYSNQVGALYFSIFIDPENSLHKKRDFGRIKLENGERLLYVHTDGKEFDFTAGKYVENEAQS